MKTDILVIIMFLVASVTGILNNHQLISKTICDVIYILLMILCLIIIVEKRMQKNKKDK